MKKLIFIYILLTSVFTQTLTETEINNLFNHVRTLEVSDSLNTLQINQLKTNLELYEKLKPYGLMQFVRSGRISVSKDSMEISKLLNIKKNYE